MLSEKLVMDRWQDQAFMVVCKNCGYLGFPERKKPGNATIEFILWCCAGIPGVIYSFWRSGSAHDVCVVCKSADVIFADSPIGKELVAKLQGAGVEPTKAADSPSTQHILNQRVMIMNQKIEEQRQKNLIFCKKCDNGYLRQMHRCPNCGTKKHFILSTWQKVALILLALTIIGMITDKTPPQ